MMALDKLLMGMDLWLNQQLKQLHNQQSQQLDQLTQRPLLIYRQPDPRRGWNWN
jgi:hypothetical protein